MALALYRRYRPDTFTEVIGQEHVTAPLQAALGADRVHHAYLFSGPRGCGKTTSARILARCLNCEQGPTATPCGQCQSCQDLARGGPGSIDVIEIDAASHGGVDDARDLRERAFFAPAASRYKIYIIDEAHMVSREGFNALLKVVEEPPPHLKFIFATTEPDRVIATIRSRTHHYPFRLVPQRTLADYLGTIVGEEGVAVDPVVLGMVARAGAGSVRDSLSILDQLIGGAGPDGVTAEYAAGLLGYTPAALLDGVVEALAVVDAANLFRALEDVLDRGTDPRRFLVDLLERLRDLLLLRAVPDAASRGLIQAADDQQARLQAQAARFGDAELSRAADLVNDALAEMRGATAPRLQLELLAARLLLPGADTEGERGLRSRLDRLERRLDVTATPAPPAPPASPAEPAPPPAWPTPAAPPAPAADAGRVAPTEPAADTEPDGPAAPGGLDVHAVRRAWPDVLEAVRSRKRVTWMLLFDKAAVLGVDGTALTLGFPDVGSVKGFTASGHDEVVRQALIDVLGADRRVDAVHAPGTPAASAGAPAVPARGGPAAGGVTAEVTVDVTTPVAAAAGGTADEPQPDDPDLDDGALAGADLVARELGGSVIAEYER